MVIVFDVNGTLLDNQALAPQMKAIFGNTVSVEKWFTEVLQYATALSLAGEYWDFGVIAKAVLHMTAAAQKVELSSEGVSAVETAMAQLPPFPEVTDALEGLRQAGFTLAALSNSAPAALKSQLAHSKLDGYFQGSYSVGMVRRYKPAADTYQAAADSLGVSTAEILMVAAHPWDLLGAARAGCRTAFVARPGKALLPGAPMPDYVADDLAQLTAEILRTGIATAT